MTIKTMMAATAVMLASVAFAKVTWYAVDPMSEVPYMPDKAPKDGIMGDDMFILAAKGEYEPCSFVLTSDVDVKKVRFTLGDLKNEKGDILPKSALDLKTVKVWYQAGNAWTSYFADPKLKLCPELLLNDEDLIKADEVKKCNYARIEKSKGKYEYRWLNAPSALDRRNEDIYGSRLDDSFQSMKPNFKDADTHQGAKLEKGRFKQFFLTAKIDKNQAAGLYKGEIALSTGEKIPLKIRVLDFELPSPKCYFDENKDYLTFFCEYVGIDWVLKSNGGDYELAKKQLEAILANFARHGHVTPTFGNHLGFMELGKRAGLDYTKPMICGNMLLAEKAPMRYHAKLAKKRLDKQLGENTLKFMTWGDEYGLATLRGIRDMIKIYHEEGFYFPVNSHSGYCAGGYLADLWWPSYVPSAATADQTFKFNQLGGDGYFGWYANQHVGVENPAFTRRQYGYGAYRAGFSCNYNYAHHLQGWNDIRPELYRPMMFVYGCGSGCIDTLSWEGFREGLDDIRYATKLLQLAKPLTRSSNVDARYTAKKALKLLADADGDDMDLTTLRLEMISYIEKLAKFADK